MAPADNAAMLIRFSDAAVAALRDLLDAYFRQRLRDKRNVLLGVRQRLTSAGDSAALAG